MSDNGNEFENWVLPKLDNSEKERKEETTLFGKPAAWYRSGKEPDEDEIIEEAPQPLTLDDIEAIRQSAYEDGFKEGKEAGFVQGLAEGKAKGETEGFAQGVAQGTEQGLIAGQTEIDKQVSVWQSLIDRLHSPLEKFDDNVEYQLVRLATSLAEQISRCELQVNEKVILQALKQGIEVLPVTEQKLRILLHPDDLLIVQNAYSPEVCLKRGWDLQAEPALARGDCQIHTQASSVDYAFSTRIEQVLKHFFKENYQRIPEKNDDGNLLNEYPLAAKQKIALSDPSSEEEMLEQDERQTESLNSNE